MALALRRLPHIYNVYNRELTEPTSLPCFPRDVIHPQQDAQAYFIAVYFTTVYEWLLLLPLALDLHRLRKLLS